MHYRYRTIGTELGHLGFVASPRGLRRLWLPQRDKNRVVRRICRQFPEAVEDRRLMPELAEALRCFFAGEMVEFAVPIDWGGYTDFQVAVWHACRRIPYGQTRSYGSLAAHVGAPRAARAVGTVMKRNPCPIIVPCHRVIASDGTLGGYSGSGGVDLKRRLLMMEAEALAAAGGRERDNVAK